VELVPQGTLAERIRAGGCGLGGILTPTGVGTVVEEGKRKVEVVGKDYLLEPPLRADFAPIHSFLADYLGNLAYALTARNFNPLMAMAGALIAKRIARELRPGMLVNLGIGIPTLVAGYAVPDMGIFFQSENGLIGTGPIPEGGMAHPTLTDAGGRAVTALPGASTFDSAMSFGLTRGGHVDVTVLGGLQVDQCGRLANWMIPGKMVQGMGGAMDLATGAKRVIVAMQHSAKGKSKIVRQCTLPLTSARPIDCVVTELAVISFADEIATLVETAPGVSVEDVLAATDAELVVSPQVHEMQL
jgi:acetate CoA/acetoacetate CoA-transferase beta subunit